jgi:hypothetical protein
LQVPKGLDDHVISPMLVKRVNGRSHPSYGDDAYEQGDYQLLVRFNS